MRFKVLATMVLFFLIAVANPLLANEDPGGSIKGTIRTADNKPAAFVTIQIKENKKATMTDENGSFTFKKLNPGKYTLQITLVGYRSEEKTVEILQNEIQSVAFNIEVSNSELQEVVVSAGSNKFGRKQSDYVARLPLKNLENPQVYNVVGKALMEEQVITTVDDALKNAPGVNRLWSSTGRPSDGASFFSMRGFSVQPTMINGVPGLTNGGIDPANIERIESIKGPSGTLFGSSLISFGGLLNIVTKKPYESFGGEVSYITGGFGLSRITADINTPLDRDKNALLRVNAAYHNEGSFQDAGFKKSFFLAPSFSYRVNDRLSFLVNAEFYTSEATNTLMVFLNRNRQLIARTPKELNMDFNRSYTSNDITYKNPTMNLFGQMNYKISNNWTSQTNLSRSVRKSDGYYSYVMFLDGNPNPPPATLPANDTLISRFVYYQNSVTTTTDLQQNFIGDFHIGQFRNRVVAGIDVLQIQSVSDNSPYALFDYVNVTRNNDPRYGQLTRAAVDAKLAVTPGATKGSTNVYTYSAYVSDVFNITPQLTAMASLRFDYFDTKPSLNYNTGVKSGKYDQKALSPKFGMNYQVLDDRLSVFANYMNGFRNVAPVASNQAADYPVNLEPQQANQYEAGVKAELFNHKLTLTASYYNIEVSNITRSISVDDPISTDPSKMLNVTIQDGSQRSRGVEVDLVANPLPGLNIVAGYGYNESKILNAGPATKDRRPNTAGPSSLANLWISYNFRAGKLQGFGAGVGGNYAGENIVTSTLATGDFTLPSYTVVNATLFYNASKFRIAIKADNIAGKEYFGGWTTVEKQMPRRYSGSVAFRF